jgi:hypothetical protein
MTSPAGPVTSGAGQPGADAWLTRPGPARCGRLEVKSFAPR